MKRLKCEPVVMECYGGARQKPYSKINMYEGQGDEKYSKSGRDQTKSTEAQTCHGFQNRARHLLNIHPDRKAIRLQEVLQPQKQLLIFPWIRQHYMPCRRHHFTVSGWWRCWRLSLRQLENGNTSDSADFI